MYILRIDGVKLWVFIEHMAWSWALLLNESKKTLHICYYTQNYLKFEYLSKFDT